MPALNKVIVADNTGTETCRIRVLSLDAEGAIGGEAAGERLTGLVLTPLATAGRRIAAATTRGEVGVFDVSGAGDAASLTLVARRAPTGAEPLAQFALLRGGNLWLAGRQLMNLTILPTENQLSVRSMDRDYDGDAFDAPLEAVDNLVIHVRRPARGGGMVVAATDSTSSRAVWETSIATPLAGAPSIDGTRLRVTAVTTSGAAFVLDRQAMVRGVQDQAMRPPVEDAGAAPLTASADLGDARLAAGAEGATRALIVNPDNPRGAVHPFNLSGPLTGGLTPSRDGLLCPTEVGQVFFLDANGEVAATPFQPELQPDRKYRWLAPASVGEGAGSQFVISDGAETLYLISLVAQPSPHLEAVKTVDVGPSPLTTPLAVVGQRILAGTEAGQLAVFTMPDLTPGEAIDIGGRVAWGPHPAGDGLLLVTETNDLLLVGGDGAIRWRRALAHGPLAGKPLNDESSVLVVHQDGGLERISLADGAEAAFEELGQPAAAGPALLGERVVVVTPDGALLVVNRP